MTVCEYFKLRYDEATNSPRPLIKVSADVEVNSFEYVDLWFEYAMGGAYDYMMLKEGVTKEQIQKAVDGKFIKLHEYSSWEARQKGQTKYYTITKKGEKAFYKYYFK